MNLLTLDLEQFKTYCKNENLSLSFNIKTVPSVLVNFVFFVKYYFNENTKENKFEK